MKTHFRNNSFTFAWTSLPNVKLHSSVIMFFIMYSMISQRRNCRMFWNHTRVLCFVGYWEKKMIIKCDRERNNWFLPKIDLLSCNGGWHNHLPFASIFVSNKTILTFSFLYIGLSRNVLVIQTFVKKKLRICEVHFSQISIKYHALVCKQFKIEI